MMSLADQSLREIVQALSERSPSPGGGAAAAISAALGCAAGAMAARYTTGTKYTAVEAESLAFAQMLTQVSFACVQAGDADATAYSALTAARKTKDPLAIEHANNVAIAVPADLLALCAQHAAGLAAYLKLCNPYLLSDVKVGIHLLCGAGRAAWQTLLINQPHEDLKKIARTHLSALQQAENAAMEFDS
jgi:methenyltetrahydrofolate cyclohydrolase